MKKIGIDARLYSQTGVGVYIRNLLFFIEKTLPKDWLLNVYLMNEDFEKVTFKNVNIIPRKANFKWHSLNEQRDFLKVLNEDSLDLMHFTYFSYPIGYKKPFVSTIHDITPLLYQTGKASTKNIITYRIKHFFLKKVFKSQVKNAAYIITPTKVVKDQLVSYYSDTFSDKIIPIYEGVNEEIKRIGENNVLKKTLRKDFLFTIGNFYPHKNIDKLIRAYAKVKSDVLLILAGSGNLFSKRALDLIKELKQEKRIVLFKNPTLSDLVYLYKHGKALINPSISEGFGLPLVEAAYFGCPVIASDIPVFKEILEKEYISFDPLNGDDITQKIQAFLHKKTVFNYTKINSKYSFETMTKETIEVYKKALNI